MLTNDGCFTRRERLWESMDSAPDCIVLSHPRHLVYFANYYPSPFSFRSQNAQACLVLKSDGSSVLIIDNLQSSFAESAHVDTVVSAPWYDGRTSAGIRCESVLTAAADELQRLGTRRFAADSAASALIFNRNNLEHSPFAVDSAIHGLMRVKDPDELEIIRRSIHAGEAGYAAARAGIRSGMTEFDAFLLVQEAALGSAREPALIYGDFASGPRTEFGGPPTTRTIEKGDLFLLDYSVVIHGYRGDLCAAWVVDGEPTIDQRRMADACSEALTAGEALLGAGVDCRAIDSAIRNTFRNHGLGDYFKSHSGHGIGLGHPDPPYIVAESVDILSAGDVITLEPGLSIPGIGGIRLEHNYLITESGFERISNQSLNL